MSLPPRDRLSIKQPGHRYPRDSRSARMGTTMTITIADALIILATLVGPIVAVQTQKWIERSREDRARKVNVFNTLMATRGLKAASADHVKALNSIDIIFDRQNEKEKRIISA